MSAGARFRREPRSEGAGSDAGSADPENGSEDGLDELYRVQAPRLVRSLARRLSNRDEAADLVQEAFLRLARLGSRGRADMERPEAYLGRVATNLLRDRAKFAARRSLDRHGPIDEATLRAADLERNLEARDMLNRLEAAMQHMRPRTREIFMAHRLDGLSYAEIAERTGLTVKGVEKQMGKALAQLQRVKDRLG